MMVSKSYWMLFLLLSFSFSLNIILVKSEGDEESNSIVTCYSCNATLGCAENQMPGDSNTTCEDNQHCWIYTMEEEGKAKTYNRQCNGICTEDSEEVQCDTTDNVTACSICCTEDNCNSGPLNAAIAPNINAALLSVSFVSVMWAITISENYK